MPTREQALAAAGRVLAEARARRDALTPLEAARLAHEPGGSSIEELAERIQAARHRSAGLAARQNEAA
ncbi:hypothetical protein C1I98_33475 [Spongiactinospora gelatinilytica]|uniref:Uncharacterized protein n=1 Tax=Spongiactinospora gelatinilytica TaxID=2666298 RepID=A0A2W2FC36_9ACTN|nr:hypothetical protein [Spongiactinospora gelatinilytica]PZG27289.1 hypothetical protein C1I98_33475 [Spongiactinospora gelatinilytica]